MTEQEEGELLRRLRSISGQEILRVGIILESAIAFWDDACTSKIIITAERRSHYLSQHPEVEQDELLLLHALLDPEEVHRNAVDRRVAILYRRLDEQHFLRIPIWISNREDRQNSVLSLRRAGLKEVQAGRAAGRLVWRK